MQRTLSLGERIDDDQHRQTSVGSHADRDGVPVRSNLSRITDAQPSLEND